MTFPSATVGSAPTPSAHIFTIDCPAPAPIVTAQLGAALRSSVKTAPIVTAHPCATKPTHPGRVRRRSLSL
jgi:hypothetical protein